MQDCNNSSALAMELLQSCTKPSICDVILIFLEYKLNDWWLNDDWMIAWMVLHYYHHHRFLQLSAFVVVVIVAFIIWLFLTLFNNMISNIDTDFDTFIFRCVFRVSTHQYKWPHWMTYHHNRLVHWGWVTHICVSKLITIGSDNGLLPGRHQAIIWTNAWILLIG